MGNQKITIRLRSFDGTLVDKSARSIVRTVQRLGVTVSGPVPLPVKISKFTVLRSTHVHKKSREQFEMRMHKRLIGVYNPGNDVIDSLTKLDIPAGVDIEIV